MNDAHLHFVSAVRAGLGAAIAREGADVVIRRRATTTVRLGDLTARRTDGGEDSEAIERRVALLGPGDVIGFDPRIVARTDPAPGVSAFDRNAFPAIEFVDADFPWRFSASSYDGRGVMPWIALVALRVGGTGEGEAEFIEEEASGERLPLRLRVADARFLPDLSQAAFWAHFQVPGPEVLDPDDLAERLRPPGFARSRLLCARRLAGGSRYAAFVVPTFLLGRRAGLGETVDDNTDALAPAWSPGETDILLPYYYRFDFITSEHGGFEELARLLRPRRLPTLGLRPLDCSRPGFGVPGVSLPEGGSVLGLEGALKALPQEPTPWGRDSADGSVGRELRSALHSLLRASDTAESTGDEPVVVPPVLRPHPSGPVACRRSGGLCRLGRLDR